MKLVNALLVLVSAVTICISVPACSAQPDGIVVKKSSRAKDAGAGTDDSADPAADPPAGSPPGNTSGGEPTPAPIDAGGTTTKSSKGTGGPTGQNELKSAGGLSYVINVPAAAATKPRGLLVLLHGSTASNYRELVTIMATVASQHDFIRASILAPNGQGWNEGNQTTAANLLDQAIQQDILTKYDVDLSRIVFSGQSSGGGFLSSYFLPLHAKNYRGGAFMQCGAAPPVPTFAPDAATKLGLRLHFEITTGDPIWPDSYKAAVAAYTTAGMTLTKDDTKPGGHCAFDQGAVVAAHLATILPP